MRIKHLLIISALAAGSTLGAMAQDNNEEPKFTFKPAGRVLVDGAVFMPNGNGLNAGAAIPDIRMGAKMGYGKWSAKIDVGYSYGKVGLKDVYIQYDFNKQNLIRAGYFVHQFGLQAATSSSMKPTMEAPITDTYMAATGRNIGIMYVHDQPSFFAGVSAMVAGTSLTTPSNEQGKTSFGGITRLVYRPLHSDGLVAQAGISGWYQTALHKKVVGPDGISYPSEGYFDFSATFPTRVCKTTMLEGDVTDARDVFKISPELLLAKGRLALEGQYYYMNVGRKNGLGNYKASGVYGMLRGIAIGGDYTYSHADAGLATPGPKSLEVVLGYNYTNASCNAADIMGGITNDASITLNYYINKYIIARLRYSYTDVRNSIAQPDRHVNIIQARLQVKF